MGRFVRYHLVTVISRQTSDSKAYVGCNGDHFSKIYEFVADLYMFCLLSASTANLICALSCVDVLVEQNICKKFVQHFQRNMLSLVVFIFTFRLSRSAIYHDCETDCFLQQIFWPRTKRSPRYRLSTVYEKKSVIKGSKKVKIICKDNPQPLCCSQTLFQIIISQKSNH
jgi:hypothetical protein